MSGILTNQQIHTPAQVANGAFAPQAPSAPVKAPRTGPISTPTLPETTRPIRPANQPAEFQSGRAAQASQATQASFAAMAASFHDQASPRANQALDAYRGVALFDERERIQHMLGVDLYA